MDEIKIDLGKVPILVYMNWVCDSDDMGTFMKLVDKAVVGGAGDRPMTDLPAICAKLSKALQEEADNIAIAIKSMQEYLKGNE